MQVILASADSSLKAGILRTLKARIDRIVHYTSVYDAVMRRHRKEVRARRKSTYAKIMAAVTLRATGGTIRGLAAFRRLERKGSGNVSGVATVGWLRPGSGINAAGRGSMRMQSVCIGPLARRRCGGPCGGGEAAARKVLGESTQYTARDHRAAQSLPIYGLRI